MKRPEATFTTSVSEVDWPSGVLVDLSGEIEPNNTSKFPMIFESDFTDVWGGL